MDLNQNLAAEFIDAASSDLRRADAILTAHPDLVDAGFYVWLVLGDWKRVAQSLSEMPGLAIDSGGPQNCVPLLYVCFSRYASCISGRAADLAETARLLLRYGADPNAAFIHEEMPDNPLPCLYAATGVNNNPALAQVLLDAGANPNDSESLYHSTEHRDLVCMKLLWRAGATPNGANALKHMLDREDMEGTQLLLEAAADPNEINGRGETALHWAVSRDRSASIVTLLLDHGADPDARTHDGRTAYAMAVRHGRKDLAAILAAHGAKTDISPLDQFLAACEVADPAELERLLKSPPAIQPTPESERALPDLTAMHRTPVVRTLLSLGWPVNARGDHGATALHWACWKGYSDLVDLLLRNGASLTMEDQAHQGTPAGWFGHGVRNCREPGGDYSGVARLLVATGAVIPVADLPTGHVDVDAVLREHGLIN